MQISVIHIFRVRDFSQELFVGSYSHTFHIYIRFWVLKFLHTFFRFFPTRYFPYAFIHLFFSVLRPGFNARQSGYVSNSLATRLS